MNLNKVFLIGRLTDNPEFRTTSGGQSICTFRIATNRVWKDPQGQTHEDPQYHAIVAWRRLAEIVSQYLSRGSLVFVEGRLQTRSWDDTQGVKKYRTEIIAERLQLGPRNASPGAPSPSPQEENDQTPPPKAAATQEIPIIEEEEEINVKDIPF